MSNINLIVKHSLLEGLGTKQGDSGIVTKTTKTAYDTVMKPATTAKTWIEKAKEKLRKI